MTVQTKTTTATLWSGRSEDQLQTSKTQTSKARTSKTQASKVLVSQKNIKRLAHLQVNRRFHLPRNRSSHRANITNLHPLANAFCNRSLRLWRKRRWSLCRRWHRDRFLLNLRRLFRRRRDPARRPSTLWTKRPPRSTFRSPEKYSRLQKLTFSRRRIPNREFRLIRRVRTSVGIRMWSRWWNIQSRAKTSRSCRHAEHPVLIGDLTKKKIQRKTLKRWIGLAIIRCKSLFLPIDQMTCTWITMTVI